MADLSCTSCGSRVEVPAGHSRAKIRCGECGYYVEVPEQHRHRIDVEEPEAVAAAASVKAPTKKKLEAPPLITGTQDEHDDEAHPYTVPGDDFKKCAACFKQLPLDATFCIHCGIDFATGKKAKKTYEAIDKSWEPRWGYDLRIKVFAGMQVLNLLIACFSGIAGSFSGGFTFMAIQGAVQAFLLGSYETLTVKRTSKGTATLWRTWRLAFVPRPPLKIDWKTSQGVGVMAIHQPSIIDWMIMVNLLIPAVLPGLLFYWYIIRPDRFHVVLCDVHGCTNDTAFRTTDREQADEICRTVNDATGLWYKPVL